MTQQGWLDLVWVLAAGLLGFAISAVFSNGLRLSRRFFLVPYLALAGLLLYGFYRWAEIDLAALLSQNWTWGLVAGALAAGLLVRNVRSQPSSARSTGAGLLFDVLWAGLGYGAMDALFLNVLPVVAVWNGFSAAGEPVGWLARIGIGALSLMASLLVTLFYHLGYSEFRNRKVFLVVVGNALITLAYLVSGNPLGAVVSHVAMHVAAVFQGPETTIQLPPHYARAAQA